MTLPHPQCVKKHWNNKFYYKVASCSFYEIYITMHGSMNMKTSPCLILIGLLFDDSCKGTCPSDLGVVMPGRHNTHLVTLSSMSVAHKLLAFFQHPSVFSFAMMQHHNFNICSLMCLSFSDISNGSHSRSLQTNKRTHIATGTYNNFILYQSLLQHASYL